MMIIFGDDTKVWIICTWLGDSFDDDDDFLVYTLEMMIERIYVNIVCLWWTCVIEDVKGDDMLFDEKRCDGVFMW